MLPLMLLEADVGVDVDVDADTEAPVLSASVVSLRFCDISLTFVSKAVHGDVGDLLAGCSGGDWLLCGLSPSPRDPAAASVL